MDWTKPPPPSTAGLDTDAGKLAYTLALIDQPRVLARTALLNSYNCSRKWVYENPLGLTSGQVYTAVEARSSGDSATLGRLARLAKAALIDAVPGSLTDEVPPLKILDPLNPPANLSPSAAASFAEIAAAL